MDFSTFDNRNGLIRNRGSFSDPPATIVIGHVMDIILYRTVTQTYNCGFLGGFKELAKRAFGGGPSKGRE